MNLTTLTTSLLLTVSSLFSYSQNSDILGIWKIDANQTISIMSSQQKSQYDSLDASLKQQIQSQLASQAFNFSADSSFTVSASGQSFGGTYLVDNSSLQLTYSNGSQTTQTIERLDGTVLILRLIEDANSPALIHRIYLSKQ